MHFWTRSSLEALSLVDEKNPARIPPGGGGGGCTPDFKGQILRDFVPTSTLHCIYNAFIQSQFDYSDIVCVIVEKRFWTGYRNFRTMLLVF